MSTPWPKVPRTRAFQIAKDNDAATIKLVPGVTYFTDPDTNRRRLMNECRLELARCWMWINNIKELRHDPAYRR